MFRFVIVSFCFLSGLSYLLQKNTGYEPGFTTLNNFDRADFNEEGYGKLDPNYKKKVAQKKPDDYEDYEDFNNLNDDEDVAVKPEAPKPVQQAFLTVLPVKKPALVLALPVARPNPNSLVQTASVVPHKRKTLSNIRRRLAKYEAKNPIIPTLKPEYLSRGKLLKRHQIEVAGTTDAVFRSDFYENEEQYSRDSQVKLKGLFQRKLKRHRRRRSLNSLSYFVRKRPRYVRSAANKKKGRRRTEAKITSTKARYRRR